jgi:hypothetical protein
MIRIIPQTAQIKFTELLTPQILIDSIFDNLVVTQYILKQNILDRDLKKINNITTRIDQLCNLIQSAQQFLEPIEYEFCKDKIMHICDFQKPYFDELGIEYTPITDQVIIDN